jgi:sulfur carrier protein
MEIILNNRTVVFEEEELLLSEIISRQKFTFKMLVTKVNGKLVKKEEREYCTIRNGDDVSVMHLISGG